MIIVVFAALSFLLGAMPPAYAAGPTGDGVAVDAATVRSIQEMLGTLGYDAGVPDGAPGPRTRAAIEAYQRDAGLPVDGVPSESLRRDLARAVATPPAEGPAAGGSSASAPAKSDTAPAGGGAADGGASSGSSAGSGSSGSFFGGLVQGFAKLSRSVGGLVGGRAEPTRQAGTTATLGIRGLDAQDIGTAAPDRAAVAAMESFGTGREEARRYARAAHLADHSVAYLPEPAAATSAGSPDQPGGNR